MKLSDYVMKFIFDQKINYIFGYQGGSITHLVDSLHKINGLTYIQNYHEQASSFCADAYSRVSGHLGAAIATSGPGATNLITGIANAYFDSVPCLFITGQVSTHAIRQSKEIRQQGFQETDIVSIVTPITKFAITVLEPNSIRFYLEKAVHYAQTVRPGPVLIDIPHNIQASNIEPDALQSFYHSDEYKLSTQGNLRPDAIDVNRVIDLLDEARRPVVLVGGGATKARCTGLFKSFVDKFDLPVVCSLMGLDSINHDDEHFCGFIGTYGNRYANMAVTKSDVLLVLGSRLDERQTGGNRSLFASEAKIIHVDIDAHELNHNICETLSMCCDIEDFMKSMLEKAENRIFDNRKWLQNIKQLKEKYCSDSIQQETDFINPNEFMRMLSKKASPEATVCMDVGQNMMWVAQSFSLAGDRKLIGSGGHGAMGYSLPAGIGAYYASPGRQIICIMGDGGIQMNLQELQTVSRENIPLKIFVLNNSSLGMIRNYQEKYFDNKCFGSVKGYANPDFKKIAAAFDIDYTKICDDHDFDKLDKGLDSNKPHFFEVVLSQLTQLDPEPIGLT